MDQYIAHVSIEAGMSGGVMLTKPVGRARRKSALLGMIRNQLGLKRLTLKQDVMKMIGEVEPFFLQHKEKKIYITFTKAAYIKKITNGSIVKQPENATA